MAKRLHRSIPASEVHPIHGWEVANAAAREALVPTTDDLGRVARQADDGSLWSLRSVTPVEWRQIDPSPTEIAVEAVAAQLAAEAAQVAAEGARDAAIIQAGVAVDEPTGRLTVADGQAFKVQGTITGEVAASEYRRVAVGTPSTKIGEYPSTAFVRKVASGVNVAGEGSTALAHLVDANGDTFAMWDESSGLVLTGDERTVQEVMALLPPSEGSTALVQAVDANGLPTQQADQDGGLLLPGSVEPVQASAWRARAGAPAPRWSGTLPAGFTPFAPAYAGQERYIWAGMPAELRPNNTRWVGYPFSWPTVGTFVDPSMVRRRTAPYTWPSTLETGTLEALTVNLPVGYAGVYQWRDLSVLYDRKLGRWFACLNSIGTYAGGFLTDRFAIFQSNDGLTWDFTTYVVPGQVAAGSAKVWSPEWFIDDDGTVYVIVGLNTGTDGNSYWAMRCDDPETMATWSVVGKLTGTAFPTNAAGGLAMNDPYLFKRDGVYYVAWAAMSSATSVASYQLGLAYATSLLGPYDRGHSFVDSNGQVIRGEGQSVVELPAGSRRRFRLQWFNVGGQTYGGRSAATMFSPCVESDDLVTFGTVQNHGADASYYQHNTAILGA